MAFSKHCSSPAGEARRSLEARGKPDGFLEVNVGATKGTKRGRQGLWSDGFGTCVGVVVKGKPKKPASSSTYLSHFSLGEEWADIQMQWDNMREAVEHSQLEDMEAWIYTVDTDPGHPDLEGDEEAIAMAESLEDTYKTLVESLQALVQCGTVTRKMHPFSKVGEIEVSANGKPKFNPAT